MSGVFETFGDQIRGTLGEFAKAASSEIISNISPVVYTCVLLYFIIRAYQVSSGRAEGTIPDVVITCAKISLVSFFALNAANFATYIIPAVYGIENILLNAVSNAIGNPGNTSAWSTVDSTWLLFMKAGTAISNLWSANTGWFKNFGYSILICLMMVTTYLAVAYYTFFAVGYLLLYEIFLVMGLAFGPLFICCLMFHSTRSWFDGWLRAVICWAFTLVAIAGILLLMDGIFTFSINDLLTASDIASKGKNWFDLIIKILCFAVMVVSSAIVIKSVPAFAAGITGGVALQAASLAGAFMGVGKTAAAVTGGTMLGYAAATGSEEGREKARNILGSNGLSDAGAFHAAALGYTAGLGSAAFQKFFGSENNSESVASPPGMGQSVQEEQTAARNAASVGVPLASGSASADTTVSTTPPGSIAPSPSVAPAPAANGNAAPEGGVPAESVSSAPSATAPSATASGSFTNTDSFSRTVGSTDNAKTGNFSSTDAYGSNPSGAGAAASASANGSEQAPDPAFDFSVDRSQFDSSSMFSEPESNPQGLKSTSSNDATDASIQAQEEAIAAQNEAKINEIFTKQSQSK